mgnify:CR=1 FL=1
MELLLRGLKELSDLTGCVSIKFVKGRTLSAGEICEHFSVTGASISRHLAILKDADLISSTSIRLCHMLIRLV